MGADIEALHRRADVQGQHTDVDVDLPGDPNKATFVQVIQGRSSDPALGA